MDKHIYLCKEERKNEVEEDVGKDSAAGKTLN